MFVTCCIDKAHPACPICGGDRTYGVPMRGNGVIFDAKLDGKDVPVAIEYRCHTCLHRWVKPLAEYAHLIVVDDDFQTIDNPTLDQLVAAAKEVQS